MLFVTDLIMFYIKLQKFGTIEFYQLRRKVGYLDTYPQYHTVHRKEYV